MTNKKIFITGGAGFLGRKFIQRYYDDNEITVYSRDEAKHYYLQKEFPKVRCIVGDVRNLDLLLRSSREHTVGVFAASLKQIDAVSHNVEESLKTIVEGAINSRRISEENNFESACFISTDKSRAATTIYGAMKYVAGESFIINSDKSNVRLSTAVYGNVLNSTGSVIPLIWKAIENNITLQLFSEHMTRFFITGEQALDLIEFGLSKSGYNIIPKIKSFKIKDLFDIFSEEFKLKYELSSPRISEKIHEMMYSKEESSRIIEDSRYYLMHYKNLSDNPPILEEYTSDKVLIDKEELFNLLQKNDFFKK